ncbi:coatomer subunit beta'-like [Branchiostoma floridae]|uniref:Coatomer subunit beta'-like n=1 Tax=Branchiostoma floridae TaxID=7739 RepID=A0A9J7MBD0_BRAFL|nr:coatomer subunit beta'-like [Branchiostoma floridae]
MWVVQLWKEGLAKTNPKAADSLADPTQYENLFPGLREAFDTEVYVKAQRQELKPAAAYPTIPMNFERNLTEEVQQAKESGTFGQTLVEDDAGSAEIEQTTQKEPEPEIPQQQTEVTAPEVSAPEVVTPKVVDPKPAPPVPQVEEDLPWDDDDDDDGFVMEPASGDAFPAAAAPPTQQEAKGPAPTNSSRKDSLDLDLDLDNLELDENIDTSDINLDDDLLKDD